jgi:hypothetical protein
VNVTGPILSENQFTNLYNYISVHFYNMLYADNIILGSLMAPNC